VNAAERVILILGLDADDVPEYEREEAADAVRQLRENERLAVLVESLLERGTPAMRTLANRAARRTIFLAGANGRPRS
jgi:hypothetical protein